MKKDEQVQQKRLFSARDLRYLVIPLMIEQLLSRSVGMLDTAMVSSVGESAVSGVSLVDSINALMITLFSALAAGGAIVAGQYLGSKDKEKSSRAAQQLLLVTTFLSLIIGAAALIFNKQILDLLYGSVDASVMENARSYFYVTAVSFPFLAIYNACAALFRGMGNSRVSMFSALIMNIINVGGNALFIYGFNMGAFGAGLSTTIARIVAAIILVALLRNPELDINVRSYSPRDFNPSMIKRILNIGIPNGLENSIFQIGKIIVASLVSTLGTISISAHAVADSLTSLPVGPSSALGLAMTTVVAQCVGAGRYEEADYYISTLMKVAYGFLFVLSSLMMLSLKPVLGFYNLSAESYNIAFRIMIYHGISSILLWTPAFALPNGLRAAGDVTFTMVISIFSMFAFRIGGSYLLIRGFGMDVLGVWISMSVDWLFRGGFFLWRWRSGRWKHRAVIDNEPEAECV